MADRDFYQRKVIEVIANLKDVSPTKINLDDSLVGVLEIDSLDFVILSSEFQNEFGFSLPESVAANIQTVNDIVEIVVGYADPKN